MGARPRTGGRGRQPGKHVGRRARGSDDRMVLKIAGVVGHRSLRSLCRRGGILDECARPLERRQGPARSDRNGAFRSDRPKAPRGGLDSENHRNAHSDSERWSSTPGQQHFQIPRCDLNLLRDPPRSKARRKSSRMGDHRTLNSQAKQSAALRNPRAVTAKGEQLAKGAGGRGHRHGCATKPAERTRTPALLRVVSAWPVIIPRAENGARFGPEVP